MKNHFSSSQAALSSIRNINANSQFTNINGVPLIPLLSSTSSSTVDRGMASAESSVLDLSNPDLRENALLELSKKRELFQDLAPLLWNSFGTMAALLQPDLKEDLKNVWPNLDNPSEPEKTWKRQWDIHGRAARIVNAIYWPTAAELAQPFSKSEDEECVVTKLKEMGIKTSTKVRVKNFKTAMKGILGVDIRVNLREDHGEYYLKEVIVLLDKDFNRVPHIDAPVKENQKFYFEEISMRLAREHRKR